jgi:hypothetical protein
MQDDIDRSIVTSLDDRAWQTYRIDTLLIPPGTLCYVHQSSGTVWMAQGAPAVRWLKEMEDDAWAATVNSTTYGSSARSSTGLRDRLLARVSSVADMSND